MRYVLSIFFILSAVYAKDYDLSLKLEKGKTYSLTSIENINLNQSIQGIEQNVDSEVVRKIAFTVEGIQGEVYDLTTTFTSLSTKMNSAMGEIVMSTEGDDSGNIFSQAMKNIINKPFKIKMKTNGTIEEVTGLEEIFKSMMKDFDTLPEVQKKQIEAGIAQSFGQEAFIGSFEMITAIYPNKKVSKNEKWINTLNMSTTLPGILTSTFKLSEVKKDYILLEGNSELVHDKDAPYSMINGMEAKTQMSGTMNLMIKIDPKTNWISEADITQDFAGNIEVKDNPMAPNGMTIPVTLKQKMKISN